MLNAYSRYLVDLANLWQQWSQSIHMRKYLWASLALIIVVGVGISFIPYLHYVGIPVAFLLISGYDFFRRRNVYTKPKDELPHGYVNEGQSFGDDEMWEDDEDLDPEYPEEYDDDEEDQSLSAEEVEELNRMFGEAPNDGSGVRE